MRLGLDTNVLLADGRRGELTDLIVDPLEKTVTHLVVETQGFGSNARAIPIEDCTADERGHLICLGALERYPIVDETQFIRMSAPVETDDDWDVGIEEVLSLPFYVTEVDELGAWPPVEETDEVGIRFHRVPKGEVEIRRRSRVLSTDGQLLGHVEGFVVDDEHHVTHVLLERGRLWGRHDVTIPLSGVGEVTNDEVLLDLTTDEVEALPPVRVRRP